MTGEDDFVLEELNRRIGDGIPGTTPDDLLFLRSLNQTLARLEAEEPVADRNEPQPIFVFGLPRAGTTLATQILIEGLGLGYISNFMARLWLAPSIASRLQDIVLKSGGTRQAFESTFGKTEGLLGPHEFSYFWQHHLAMKDTVPNDLENRAAKVDWEGLKLAIDRIRAAVQRPLVMKCMLSLFFFERFQRLYPEATYVFIERPSLDVACSLAVARERYYGTRNQWWSLYTPDWPAPSNWPWDTQIAHQVRYLESLLASAIQQVPQSRRIVISYESMCNAPKEFACDVGRFVGGILGKADISPLPDRFDIRIPSCEPEVRETLKRALIARNGHSHSKG